ncbi:hypothetical protein LguiA_012039 [Lonicera macranthoides]
MKSQEVPKRQSGALLCPFQRHISPMLDLGTALHTKGFFITVAHTMFNSPDTSNHPDFTFLPLADNLSEHDTSPGNLLALMKTINNLSNVKTSSAIIWNIIDYIGSSSLSQLQQYHQVPSFLVSPLHKMDPFSSTSLLKEDSNCIPRLNKQAPNSVIYVSLRSLATMDQKELKWVKLLPKGFKEATRERVFIVKWAPQKDVLAHSAVGGVLDPLRLEFDLRKYQRRDSCDMQAMSWDQPCHVWRVGLQVEHELERDEIEKAIRTLMVDKAGEETR